MANVKFLVGSTYGNAEQIAEDAAEQLNQLGHQSAVLISPIIDDVLTENAEVVVICTATIGEGEIPDNLLPLYDQLREQFPLLPNLKYAVIALGDSSYDHFADAGRQMDELMKELQALDVQDMLVIDACETPDPEEVVAEWINQLHHKI